MQFCYQSRLNCISIVFSNLQQSWSLFHNCHVHHSFLKFPFCAIWICRNQSFIDDIPAWFDQIVFIQFVEMCRYSKNFTNKLAFMKLKLWSTKRFRGLVHFLQITYHRFQQRCCMLHSIPFSLLVPLPNSSDYFRSTNNLRQTFHWTGKQGGNLWMVMVVVSYPTHASRRTLFYHVSQLFVSEKNIKIHHLLVILKLSRSILICEWGKPFGSRHRKKSTDSIQFHQRSSSLFSSVHTFFW